MDALGSAIEPFRQSHLPVDALKLPGDTQGVELFAVVGSWLRWREMACNSRSEKINSLKLICFDLIYRIIYISLIRFK
jgi:hypothetical protein